MSRPSSNNPTQILDATGVIIGEHNTIYQYFFHEPDYLPLASKIYNFTTLIEEKTEDFTGREFVFNAIDQFLVNNDRGYFIVEGDPGIGKTAVAANLVRSRGYLHHFVIKPQGIIGTEEFLINICAQLIPMYKLKTEIQLFIQQRLSTGSLSAYLGGLLFQVSKELKSEEQCIIVIDALDEAIVGHPGENILSLPSYLPKGIFFIVTRRPKPMNLYIDVPFQVFTITSKAENNIRDIKSWLTKKVAEPRLAQILSGFELNHDDFIRLMANKSEGNFIYIRHVLYDINNSQNFEPTMKWFKELPQGLVGYYERHWKQMQEILNFADWESIFEPTICILAVAQEPLSALQIAKIIKVDPSRVSKILRDDWREFLHQEVRYNETQFQLYHTTFQEYLGGKVDLAQYHGLIADYLEELYTNRKNYKASSNTSEQGAMIHSDTKEKPNHWKKLIRKVLHNG